MRASPANFRFRDVKLSAISLSVFASLLFTATAFAKELPAFPGAEGFGRLVSGGRGGDVYEVTNLNDSGPGSLREAFRSATGPRTIVFGVSGTILLKSQLTLNKSSITIAGQTAPGDGICLRDYGFQIEHATNIIVRYLRMRLGDQNKPKKAKGDDDTFNTQDVDGLIVDHCSLSWGIDSNYDSRRVGNFTLQWCIISESLNHSRHEKGEHAMCASFREPTDNITLHHNLFSTCRDRHPTLGDANHGPQHLVDFRNNLDYNWSDPGTCNFCDDFINCINNDWRPGPMTGPTNLPIAMKGNLPDMARGHMAGNIFEERPELTRDNYAALDFHRWLRPNTNYKYRGMVSSWRVDHAPDLGANLPQTQSPAEATDLVLKYAGASLHRDSTDERIVNNARTHQGKVIDSQEQVGGWPLLRSLPAPADRDHDGIPDAWEKAHGLNPSDPSDASQPARDGSGYTNLEEYINSLCQQ